MAAGRAAPEVARTEAALRERLGAWRRGGARIGLVPTMGAIHAGHLSLVDLARARAQRVCATIFVNPRQFGPSEDFAAYPREEESDLAKFAARGVDLVFAPEPAEMYPQGFATSVTVAGLGEALEGASRPGFFTGVATVVTKLLILAAPDVAVFGEKDYQQLLLIRRLVADLSLSVEIVGAPTVREADGLACSSRNAYLSGAERARAPALFRTLRAASREIVSGRPAAEATIWGRESLVEAGFARVDYFEARDAATLAPLAAGWRYGGSAARLLAAATIGRTRLIDNVAVEP
ncbi:MAG: pantoate--beta-alanine ligase [Proteobacteria bacterium]|nr:pantoate--beta-alanine ligase [Pseudomonadota bacterium]